MYIGDCTFKKWHCKIDLKFYSNGRKAIVLSDKESEEPIATATVNIPQATLPDDRNYCFIKNWSENDGVLQSLQEAKIIGEILAFYPTGYAEAMLVKILVDTTKELTDES